MLAQTVSLFTIIAVMAYLLVTGYLGWMGYRGTKTAADYLVAGRKTHPFIMAMSYAATFISTSAIVGFGGVAAMFGMSLLWLVFLNIFVGIFIAFVFLGGPTRRMGHALEAHTFPELLGKRYQSRFIQVAAGLIITCFIPLYAAAVLIGGVEFIVQKFHISWGMGFLILGSIVAAYVVAGGLKSVMYTDALQGSIMIVGMAVLLFSTYYMVGGVTEGHRSLTDMAPMVPASLKAIGHQGWTAMPQFGFGDKKYELWWIVISTITLGVGIGVLAQPQLVVRFMTVKSKRELKRAVLLGGFFILFMPGVAYTVGALSNVYFYKVEKVVGRVTATDEKADVIAKKERGQPDKTVPCRLLHVDTTGDGEADTILVAEGLGAAAAAMPKAEVRDLGDGRVEITPHSLSLTRAVVRTADGRYMFNADSIIPTYVTSALPEWFGTVFLLTLLAAAMSTLSSQFHTLGTAFGHDVVGQLLPPKKGAEGNRTIHVVRIGIILGLVLAATIGYTARGEYIIARATAIFFGLCSSAFLPAYMGGLFFKRMTRAAAIASMAAGFTVTAFWLLFVKATEASAVGLVQIVTGGKASLLADYPNWPTVDPTVIALPISILVAVVVALLTKPPAKEHLAKCFAGK